MTETAMTKKKRTESQPSPLSEEQAKTVVGGQQQNEPSQNPCSVTGCPCQYAPPDCDCNGHSHM